VILLAVLIGLLLLYLWIPQVDPEMRFAEGVWILEHEQLGRLLVFLGLTDIQHSWYLYSSYLLLFVNLCLCMLRRFHAMWVLARFPESPPPARPGWLERTVPAAGKDPEGVARFLRARGYRTRVAGNTVYGLRGRLAVAGHWIFHVSFLVLIAAGIYMAATPEGFRGTAGIGEGEPFDLHHAPFLATNDVALEELPPLSFRLDSVTVTTEGNDVSAFDVALSTSGGDEAVAGINRPYREGPYQVMASGFGYMPGWALVDARGRMSRGAWVKLVPFPHLEEDSFSLGPRIGEVQVSFYPDHFLDEGEDASAGYALRNPRFRTRIVLGSRTLFEGLLEPDQRVPLDKGRSFLFLPEVRQYAMLNIIQEKGHAITFAALGLMIAGLLIRYIRVRKEILVRVGGDSLRLSGQSEILHNLFEEELDRLASDLAREHFQMTGQEVMA
jgi:hypothetical protein